MCSSLLLEMSITYNSNSNTHGTKKSVRINRVFELSEVKITKKYASKSFKLKVLDV